ncbi:MAG: peptidoglycan editing factor PgeF [Candidatus Paceibacterota bacterium]|jgi:hypothetical protein
MANLEKFDNLIWGLSEKKDGNMKLDIGGNNPRCLQNRCDFFAGRGINYLASAANAGLVHGNKIAMVDGSQKGKVLSGYDALITNIPGIILTITVADCLPLYFYDPEKRITAIAHAGWRAVKLQIASETAKIFLKNYKADPKNIIAYIGPHIRSCHFEVSEDTLREFPEYPQFISKRENKTFIDLSGIVEDQLLASGLAKENISVSQECTHCLDKYFSYRRDKPQNVQTMIAYIGWKN